MNVQYLIDKNKIYQKTLQDIEINQKKYLKDFNSMENELATKFNKIEESKLILNDEGPLPDLRFFHFPSLF